MATQTQAQGTDLWFVTDIDSHKLDEPEYDPHVNLAYYRDGSREWVSVSGTATVTPIPLASRPPPSGGVGSCSSAGASAAPTSK